MNDARPTAGRLRRPSWRDPRLLIGIALMAASVVAVTMLVSSADTTRPVYAARDTLAPGTVLESDDLVVAQVKVAESDYVDAEKDSPVGMVLTRTVGAGELVPMRALVTEADSQVRSIAVTSDLPLDEAVRTGALVDVWMTTLDEAGAATTNLLGEALVVTAVGESEGAFASADNPVVYVGVPRAEVAAFLQALAAGGEVSVIGFGGAS